MVFARLYRLSQGPRRRERSSSVLEREVGQLERDPRHLFESLALRLPVARGIDERLGHGLKSNGRVAVRSLSYLRAEQEPRVDRVARGLPRIHGLARNEGAVQ